MNLQSRLNFMDWELRALLVFTSIFLALLSFVETLNVLGFQLPIILQLIGFSFLNFVPGTLILRLTRIEGQTAIENFLYTIGLSLAFTMALGATLNALGTIFATPLLTTPSIAISTVLFTLGLMAAIYLKEKGEIKQKINPITTINHTNFKYKHLAICLLPLVSIFGTIMMNYYGNNALLLILLVVISILPIVVTFNKIPPKLYPVLIFSISLSLLLHNSLITSNLSGWDIHLEYYFANLVQTDSSWNPTLPSNYNAMLSVVMIGPIFSNMTGLSLEWVFKVTYPLLFALVPIVIYELVKKKINETTAFLSTFFFMATYVFYSEMVQLARQEIASIFLVLLFNLVIDEKLKNNKYKVLFAVFGLGLIVSHYSLTYLFLFSAFSVWLILSFMEEKSIKELGAKISAKIKRPQKLKTLEIESIPHTTFIPIGLICLLGLFTFLWYFFTASATSLTTLAAVLDRIFSATSTGLFNQDTSQALSIITNSQSLPIHDFNKILYFLLEFFIVIGFAILLFRIRASKLSRTYLAFAFVSLLIALASISLPYFSDALNASRMYLFTLIFLAPLALLGGSSLVQFLCKTFKRKCTTITGLRIMAILLSLFLLFNSGFIYEVTNNAPTMMALNNSVDYPRFSDEEVKAAKWLSEQVKNEPANTTVTVYGDIYGSLLLTEYIWPVYTFWGNTDKVADNSTIYIFFRSINTKGQVMAYWPSSSYIDIENSSFGKVLLRATKVYQSQAGDAEIYKLSTLRMYSPYLFKDGFEEGLWPYTYINNATITSTVVYSGTQALICSTSTSCVETKISGTRLFFYEWVYLDTLPADYTGFQVMSASTAEYKTIFWIDLLQSSGVYYVGLGYNYPKYAYVGTPFSLTKGTWYEIQLEYNQGPSGGYTVWLNGIEVISDNGLDTSNGTIARSNFGRLWDNSVGSIVIDDIRINSLRIPSGK